MAASTTAEVNAATTCPTAGGRTSSLRGPVSKVDTPATDNCHNIYLQTVDK